MTQSIEFLKNAKRIGATHNLRGRLIKGAYLDDAAYEFNEASHEWVIMEFYKSPVLHSSAWADCKIDFTPLDDYQQDKALDIAATGECQ